jgi:hypothetical protein
VVGWLKSAYSSFGDGFAGKSRAKDTNLIYKTFLSQLINGVSSPLSVPPDVTVFSVQIEQKHGSYAMAFTSVKFGVLNE